MISISLVHVGTGYVFNQPKGDLPKLDPLSETNQWKIDHENRPDIYYIILDGYAREDTLRDLYDFDNTDFINSLNALGFVVANKSISNYATTELSIASTLNMQYIDDFLVNVDHGSKDKSIIAKKAIYENLVGQLSRSIGYKYT